MWNVGRMSSKRNWALVSPSVKLEHRKYCFSKKCPSAKPKAKSQQVKVTPDKHRLSLLEVRVMKAE